MFNKHFIHFYLRNCAVNIGAIRGHTDYTRFILLGRARTGSNFLMTSLESHRRIVTFGEIYNINRYYHPRKLLWRCLLFAIGPVQLVEKQIFRERLPENISAVGFKLFYHQAQNEWLKPIWAHWQEQKNLRIIHLKRKNILRTYLSMKKVLNNGQVIKLKDRIENEAPVTLEYDSCLKAFTRTRAWEQEYDTLFQHHPKIEVVYEDLVADYVKEMVRIQTFLGVAVEDVRPATHKQARLPLSQAIANYDELKERFQGTLWAEFFEE